MADLSRVWSLSESKDQQNHDVVATCPNTCEPFENCQQLFLQISEEFWHCILSVVQFESFNPQTTHMQGRMGLFFWFRV